MRFLTLPLIAHSALILSCGAATVTRQDLHQVPGGVPGELHFNRDIRIGKSVTLPLSISVTAKGNGTMTIGNLRLRVYDAHNDGLIYQDDLLNVDFVDIDGSGYKQLIISGCAIHTGEKEGDPWQYESIVYIYRFLPPEKRFVLVYRKATFDLEL